jgi:hypothetical protein
MRSSRDCNKLLVILPILDDDRVRKHYLLHYRLPLSKFHEIICENYGFYKIKTRKVWTSINRYL